MISKIILIWSVIENIGSGIPNAECSMLTNPKKKIKINENVTKLNPCLNTGAVNRGQ